MTPTIAPPKPLRKASSGFALIASLSIMSLLVLIGVALFSLSAVATRSAEIAAARTEAMANAKMALNIALGELQYTMGPDKRISARGVTLAKHPELETSILPDDPKAWWVGAASSDPSEKIGSSAKSVSWLISGLDRDLTAKEQLDASAPFERPIPMLGPNTYDLDLTNGKPVVAGAVPIAGTESEVSGAYAYYIDDNGMKAQLTAHHPDLLNVNDESSADPASTVIPGSYDPGILQGMDAFAGLPISEYLKLFSLDELPLLAGDPEIVKDKYFSYTTRSVGVLSDVKEGGLKKDLTIAFENHTTSADTWNGAPYPNMPNYPIFDEVFSKTNDSNWDKYLVLDESKHDEFGTNGYIHWAMLRDYYNMKRYIERRDGYDFLHPITIDKGGIGMNYGTIGPHDMQPGNSKMPNAHRDMPYGDYDHIPSQLNGKHDTQKEYVAYYKHSPILPVLSQLQINAWLEKVPATDPNDPSVTEALQTNTQLWVSHYNPYNIAIRCVDYPGETSLRMQHHPNVHFSVPNTISLKASRNKYDLSKHPSPYQSLRALNANDGYHVPELVYISPGHGQFCAFEREAASADSHDGASYGVQVKDLTLESSYNNFYIQGPSPANVDWFVDIHDNGAWSHGLNNWAGKSWEVSQILFSPIALETVKGGHWKDKPGVRLQMKGSSLNANSMVSFSMLLRSTMEEGASIRPLVDSNIRGFYFNPRWDSPLNLDMNAAYTRRDNLSDDIGQIPQMNRWPDGKGTSYWGAGHDPFAGYDRVILFDVPRQDLVSLGQLQHANVGRFSYEPSYVIGNSYANPRLPLDEWKDSVNDSFSSSRPGVAGIGSFDLYDASYLVNEFLWDSYIFTTIPQVADNYNDPGEPTPNEAHFQSLLEREAFLPNPRFIPYEPGQSTFTLDVLQEEGDSSTPGGFDYNAGHLLVDGAFNVNSTSVDAWEAFLSGTYGLPYQQMDAQGQVTGFVTPDSKNVRFPRVQSVLGEGMTTGSPDENYWVGFRALTGEEVRALAEEIVNQIIARGPSLTLGEFINRKLENNALGESGTLQAALDNTVNENPISGYDASADHPDLPDNSNQAAGFPGQLLQGDILQALSPFMTVRSDTFTIRAYGDSVSPTGEVVSKIWCEAVVQRFPDPNGVDPQKSYLEELARPSSASGRAFKVVSFRWLNENEI